MGPLLELALLPCVRSLRIVSDIVKPTDKLNTKPRDRNTIPKWSRPTGQSVF